VTEDPDIPYDEYHISFTMPRVLDMSEEDDEERFYLTIEGSIDRHRLEEQSMDVTIEHAGRLTAYLLRVEDVFHAGDDLFQYFDAISHDAHEAFAQVFDEKGEFRDDVLQALGPHAELVEYESRDVMHIAKVELAPEHRGLGLGQDAVRCLLQTFRPMFTIALINPYPLYKQHELDKASRDDEAWFKRMAYDRFTTCGDAAAAKLRTLWQALGFTPIADSTWHVWHDFPRLTASDGDTHDA